MKSFNFTLILFILTTMPCLMMSCSDNDNQGVVSKAGISMSLNSEEKLTNTNVQYFSLNFYKAVNSQMEDQGEYNFIVSPLSAAISMTMVANLCDNDASLQILEAFNYTSDELPRLNSLISRMTKEMPGVLSSVSKLNFANSLWIDKNYACNKESSSYVSELFDAKVSTTDLNSQSGENEINEWVSNITSGAIENLYKYDPAVKNIAVLANALYFEAPWSTPFDKGKTKSKTFYNTDGTTSKVDMMKGDQDVSYYEDDEVQSVSFSYEKSSMRFLVIMPKNGESVSSMMQNLSIDDYNTVVSATQGGTISVTIPKVEIESKIEAVSALYSMGIKSIFSGGAFEDFISYNACIGKCTQKSLFSISEEKTKVASATSSELADLGLSGSQASLKDLGEIVIDHPFLYAIYDGLTKTIIAMGQVTKL